MSEKTSDKNKLGTILTALFIVMIGIAFLYLPMKTKYVTGVAGSGDGNFAVCLSLRNGENRHDLLFYNNKGQFVKRVTFNFRGSIAIGSIDEHLVVQANNKYIKYVYDFNGNAVNDVTYSKKITPKYKLSSDNYTISYEQDLWGNEHIFYTMGNNTIDVDIHYDYYRNLKLGSVILLFLIVLFITWRLVIKFRKEIIVE
ncbi:MAG: hypothetical protein SOZ56_04605 [Oscillospiraceae bacterium]|nr:hypothetical protein [Oscillospiraceae bacterium]